MAAVGFQPDAMSRVVAGVALFAMVIALGVLVAAHLRRTGLSPLHNAVSQYGISSAAPLYRTQTLAMAVAAAALIVSGAMSLREGGIVEVATLLGVFAVTRAAISWYPMDVPGSPRSHVGTMHGILAASAFVSVGLAANRLSRILNSHHLVPWWSSTSGLASVVMALTLVVMFASRLSPGVRRYFGLIERLFYLSCSAWLVAFAVACAFTRS
jgi:hypothetical protein